MFREKHPCESQNHGSLHGSSTIHCPKEDRRDEQIESSSGQSRSPACNTSTGRVICTGSSSSSSRVGRKACILVLLGLPGSGKTTLASTLTSFLSGKNSAVKSVMYDELVPLDKQAEIAESGGSFGETKGFRASMRGLVEAFLLGNPHSSTSVVIVDDNNYYRSMRYEYYQLAAIHVVGYLQVYLKCSPDEASVNNALRPPDSRVPDKVIREMHDKFEVPVERWENNLTIDAKDSAELSLTLDQIWRRIQDSVENPVTYLQDLGEKKADAEQSRQWDHSSVLRKIDTALRKQVGLMMAQPSVADKSALAPQLNAVRKSILDEVKSGVLALPHVEPIEDWTSSLFLARFSMLNQTC